VREQHDEWIAGKQFYSESVSEVLSLIDRTVGHKFCVVVICVYKVGKTASKHFRKENTNSEEWKIAGLVCLNCE
jgi:hypothetical protein